MPRKPHVPTREQRDLVTVLAGGGVRQDLICRVVGISVPTLEKAYKLELATGKARITGKAIATLVKAMDSGGRGAVGAAAFWLKCREGWQETTAHRLVDGEGKDKPAFDLAAIRSYMESVPDDEE